MVRYRDSEEASLKKASTTRAERAAVDAIERVFRDESRKVWRALVAFTGGRREVAEDALSEAFARALRYADSIREPKSWIYTTAFRVAAEDLRRERRNRRESPPVAEEGTMAVDEVMLALRDLSPNQRAAIALHYYVGLRVREVARVLSMSPATVKVHLFRGRGRLRTLLESREGNDG